MSPIRLVHTFMLACVCVTGVSNTAEAQKRQRDRITREEIMASALQERDLFQVIRSLRPHFLEPPKGRRSLGGNANNAPVALYVDDKKDLGIESLRTMDPKLVDEVRYLEPSASTSRFGPMVNGGAILVKLYKAPRTEAAKADTTSSR